MTKIFLKIRLFDWLKKIRNQELDPGVSLPYLSEVYDVKSKIGFHHKSQDICDKKSPKTSKITKNSCFFAQKHIKPSELNC
jgi:hypothetical protein